MKLSWFGSSDAEAVSAGRPSEKRKAATPTSSARIVTAAITAVLEKIRSPRRRRPPDAVASSWPALVVVSNRAMGSDLADRGSYSIAPTAVSTLAVNLLDRGAEPAASAASSCPSGLTAYSKNDFTRPASSADLYLVQPISEETRMIG